MKEFGGCLSIEINSSHKDYYYQYNDNRVDVDSGRSGLQYVIENNRYKRIWLPVYNCPLVEKRIREVSDIEIKWYNINSEFMPKVDVNDFREGDVLLWVNYYGIIDKYLIDYVAMLQEKSLVSIIIDNIQAYFSEPRMNVLNLYSCRKFIGVPDGGHVIGCNIKKIKLPTYSSAENYYYLLKAIETGSNSAYSEYQESEKRFSESDVAYGMPILTKRFLESVDYERIIKRRKENFLALHDLLKNNNRLNINISTDTPSVYPYLTTKKQLRDKLISNRIYVSRFWKHVLTNDLANDFEKNLAEYLIPLPIDQRYEKDDMEFIANKIIEFERESTE